MKKLLFTLSAICLLTAANAQTHNAKVIYEERIALKLELEGEAAQFAAMLPKEQKATKALHFTDEGSIFLTEKKPEATEMSHTSDDGGEIKIKMNRPEEITYCDIKNNRKIEQKEFMSRKFIIESEIDPLTWKLTGNQKMLLGFPCQEAVREDSAKKTVAWFTPAIPVSVGPSGFEGLPGLVLAVDVNGGEYTLNALSVEKGQADTKLVVKPTDGKKMNKAAYKKMVDEKTAEMRQQMGGSGKGNVIIKVENR